MSEPGIKEVRQPDFPGLMITEDPLGGARITQNCDLWRLGELDSRGGLRRLNHRRYTGGVQAILDVQRICDYGKVLVCQGNGDVFEHEEAIGPSWGGPVGPGDAGGSGAVPFVAKGYPPVALASANPASGLAPLDVQFSSAGSFDPDGGAITYFWDFGDGADSSQANPLHTYAGSQIYNAQLTVTDSEGQSASATVQIDTRDILVAASALGGSFVSVDGGVTWAVTGMPGAIYHVLRCGIYLFAFRANGAQCDVYRSEDGLAWNLISNFPMVAFSYFQPIVGAANRIIVPHQQVATNFPAVSYSDDFGMTWTLAVVAAIAGTRPAIAHLGGNQIIGLRQNPLGAGNPYRSNVSNDNGATWGASANTFGDSQAGCEIVGAQGGRAIASGSAGGAGSVEIHTSDDLAIWTQRHVFGVGGAVWGLGADGQQGFADGNCPNGPAWTNNRGTGWTNYVPWAAFAYFYLRRSDGWFAGLSNDEVHFGADAAFPNFALLGSTPLGFGVNSLASLRE